MKDIVLVAILIYAGLGVFLYFQQRSFIYFPVKEISTGLEDIRVQNGQHQIKISLVKPQLAVAANKKAILYFGGNAEAVHFNAEDFKQQFPGHTAFLVHYRGYGGSSGVPTEQALYDDALVIFDEIRGQYESVSVIGRSLGSAVATYTAANRPVDKLVLVTPFDSVLSVAQSQYPIYPVKWMLKDRHDSLGRVNDIEADTLILAAELDRVITLKHTQRLAEGFGRKATLHTLTGVGHNDISEHADYYPLMIDYLR